MLNNLSLASYLNDLLTFKKSFQLIILGTREQLKRYRREQLNTVLGHFAPQQPKS